MPRTNVGVLWYYKAQDLLYTGFAGDTALFVKEQDPSPPLNVWTLKVDGKGSGAWTKALGSDDQAFSNMVRTTRASIAQGPDTGWVLNGQETSPGPNQFVSGMIEVDMGSNKFTNLSTTDAFPQPFQTGRLQFVPTWGSKGILVSFGGSTKSNEWPSDNSIPVYDIANQTWVNQTVTGDNPRWRNWFCAEGIQSPTGTYEILMYGGYDAMGTDAVAYDDIHILTLPAFHWIRVPYDARNPRGGHTCNAAGGAQILVVGGSDPSVTTEVSSVPANQNLAPWWQQDQMTLSTPDTWTKGIGVFDMTNMTWKDRYEANPAPYRQSDLVSQYYQQAGR